MAKLLVVDDNEQNRYLLAALLKGHGYDVITAVDGADALNAARENPPDMIVTDILMPGMDGYSLCREWRLDEKLRKIPLVFYTATYTDTKDEEFSMALGAARFIIKPQEPDVLIRMLEEVMDEQESYRQNVSPENSVEDTVFLKKYNEALIRKLEDKLEQLESANRNLEREIMERRNAEEALRQSEKELRVRSRIADVFLTVTDERIFEAVLQIVLEGLESELGLFGYIDRNGALVVPGINGSVFDKCQIPNKSITFPRDTWGDSIWVRSITEEKTLCSNTLSTDTPKGQIPIQRFISSPLMDQAEVIGLLMVANKAADYSEEDISRLESIGKAIAPILSARLHRDRELEERTRLESQLRQAMKMEAIGRLAGGVAHDFNNILQAMIMSSSMLMDCLPENGEPHEFAEEIFKGVERASALTGHLLAFSRSQILKMEDLNLNEVIRSMMKMIRRVIGEDVEIRFQEGIDLSIVHADRGQMEQILLNFCVNSRDAMPEGGTLTIETESFTMTREFCETYSCASQGQYVVMRVTDNGCGMDSQTQARIFEPFFTTKEVGKGTGLGLATVYGIVRQHQGMVQVYSEVGNGTTFTVYLPCVEQPAVSTEAVVAVEPTGGDETILVAEDDDLLRKLATNILDGAGYNVLQAADGMEALEIFKVNAGRIDLMLLDMIMPKMSGKGVYNALHLQHPNLRFLFSSGYTTSSIHSDFVREKGIEMIQKPYTPNALLRRIREVLATTAVIK